MAIVDFAGQFLRVNGALCELVGRARPELLAMSWQEITHPDDVPLGEAWIADTLANKQRTFRLSKRYLRPAGDVVWVLLSVSIVRSEHGQPLCLFTQAVDITEQRRAEEGVAQLAAIVQSSDDAILSHDLDGTILTWNRAAERMYGYGAEEVVGTALATIVPPDRRTELRELLAAVLRGESVIGHETVRVRKDGARCDGSLTISPIRDARGNVVSASTIVRDITEQKRTAARLDATLHALERALEEARAAEQRSHRFLSDAAHHLRNPVAGIWSCAETILRGCPARDQERLISEMIRDTAQVSRLVDRLLRLSRLKDEASLVLEQCDLGDIALDSVERGRSLVPRIEISLYAATLPPMRLDRRAVSEMLASLLDNACRHAPERVDVSIERRRSSALVRITDDGPGLKPSEIEHAFQPFGSIESSGSGLGLAFSRAVARAHGGDLIYDRPSFVVQLPIAGAGLTEPGRAIEDESSSEVARGPGRP